ncbi:hypothetical protein KXV85_002538, partial [Aspergillus fumigatus]
VGCSRDGGQRDHERHRELRFDHMGGPDGGGRMGACLDPCDGASVMTAPRAQHRVDQRMEIAPARIGLERNPVGQQHLAQSIGHCGAIIGTALIEVEKAILAFKGAPRARQAVQGQLHRQNAVACGKSGLQTLGQRAVGNALAIAASQRGGDAEGMLELHRIELQQSSDRAHHAENAKGRGSMPAKILRGGQRQTHRNIQPHRHGRQIGLPVHPAQI